MNDSLTRKEKKIAILSKLARKNKIGMNYIPVEKTVSKIPSHARGDIGDIIDEMYHVLSTKVFKYLVHFRNVPFLHNKNIVFPGS